MNYLIDLFGPDLYNWVVLPLIIALARILDVTVGTIRVIFVSRGLKYYAPLLGFFEVIIWLLAIGQIMQQLDNFMCYIGYGAGFAMGNYIGILLVEKMSLGTVIIKVIPKKDTSLLVQNLREANYGVTTIPAFGKDGPVQMVYSILKKKNLPEVIGIINHHNPHAFFTIEEVYGVNEGFFKAHQRKNNLFGGIFSGIQIRK